MRRALSLLFTVVSLSVSGAAAPVQYWDLSTGSHIAYIRYAAVKKAPVPVIFIHGGPGAYEVTASRRGIEWFTRLNNLGFDVWYYDQIGSGLSARLSDPRQYTVKRHVADLDAIRRAIGAKHFIAVGESWGATLLANYMATCPGVVSRAAFVSPGPIDRASPDAQSAPPQVDDEFMDWVLSQYPEKRARYARLNEMLRHNVLATFTEYPDREMDPLLDAFVNLGVGGHTVHDPAKLPSHLMEGMGWWVWLMTNWDAASHSAAPQKKLAGDRTLVLVMRGKSDYLPMQSAREYVSTFAAARFVEVPKAGHLIWLDQQKVYSDTLEAFFLAKPGK